MRGVENHLILTGATKFFRTSNFIGPGYHTAILFSGLGSIVVHCCAIVVLLFSGLGSIVVLFVLLFLHSIL